MIATFMLEKLREQLAGISTEAGKAAVAAFKGELESVTRRLQEAEGELKAFIEISGGGDPAEMARQKTGELTRLHALRNRLIAEEAELEGQRGGAVSGGAAPSASSDRIAGNAIIQQLTSSVHAHRVSLAALLKEVTEEHPDVIAVKTQLGQAEAELEAEIDSVLRGVETELQSRTREIETVEAELAELPAREFEYSRLGTEVEALRQFKRELQRHVDSMNVTADSGIASLNVKVIDRAFVSPAANPDIPSWAIVALVGLFFAAGVTVVLPPFIEYWRDPVRGPVDMVEDGLVPLAVIPRLPASDAGQTEKGGDA